VVQRKGVLGALSALQPVGREDVLGKGGAEGLAAVVSTKGALALAAEEGTVSGKGSGGGGTATIGGLGTAGGGTGRMTIGTKGDPGGAVGSVGAGAVSLDSSEVDQHQLAGFVRARMGGIKACYEAELRHNRAAQGRLRVTFTILETGSLADVSATADTLTAPEVARCVLGFMRSWHTPFRPSSPVSVEYPLVFSPREG
jgi:hypothetical protein